MQPEGACVVVVRALAELRIWRLCLSFLVTQDIVLIDLVVPLVPAHMPGVEEYLEKVLVAVREEGHIDPLLEIKVVGVWAEDSLDLLAEE